MADEVSEDSEIEECEIHVDRDGIVVGIRAEVEDQVGMTRTNVDGHTGDVTVEEPDWISEG